MERRFDDCDLDLRHGDAGVHAGARRNVPGSAAVQYVVIRFVARIRLTRVGCEVALLRRM